jgi:hypothetical protein
VKHLKVAIYEIRGVGNFLEILEQTHRGSDFGWTCEEFNSSRGVCLRSRNHPEATETALYVRGNSKSMDNVAIRIKQPIADIIQAVREYNKAFQDLAPTSVEIGPAVKMTIIE